MMLRFAAFHLILLGFAGTAMAQVERNIPMKPFSVDESYLTGLKWRSIGPNRGGRSTEQDYAVFADLSQRPDRELAILDRILSSELPLLNSKLSAAHLPPIQRKGGIGG